MWERYPPRMRRAVVNSLEFAGQCGRDAAGPEHLLLAIASDPQSGGAYVLEQCGVNLEGVVRHFGNGHTAESDKATTPPPKAGRLDPAALLVLDQAAAEAQRQRDEHIGTEHIAMALAQLPDLDAGKWVREHGLTEAAARAALARWVSEGMPRQRRGFAWRSFRSPAVRAVMRPLQRLARTPELAWKVLVRKSLASPRYVGNPYPLYRWLREHEPVRRDPIAPVWVLTRYEDIAMTLRESRFRKDPFAYDRLPKTAREQLGGAENRVDVEAVSMLFLDPPQHTKVRGIFSRAFTPRTLADLRVQIERITRERLDAVEKSGRMDVIADLAYPLPAVVIAEILGFPVEDYEQIKKWSDDFAASLALRPTEAVQARAAQSRREIRVYFDRVAEEIKKQPNDTIMSGLLHSEQEVGGLNREEIFSNGVLLLAAGHETTTNLIGNGVLAMMRNREQWESLVAEPGLIGSAVEEMLRFDAPVQWISRVAGEKMTMGGMEIKEGEVLLGSLGAANRDPARFPDPDKFDIQRKDNKHLSFGLGIHYCLGAALARMEAEIAVGQLAARFPRMRLERKRVKWIKGLTFRGVKRLPLILR